MARRGPRRPGACTAGLLTALTALTAFAPPASAASAASLDPSFGSGGSVVLDLGGVDEALDVAVMSDGRIVVLADSGGHLALARFLPNGAPDPTFSGDGTLVTPGYSGGDLALQPDGRVVVAGSALLRYTVTGALDPSFGGNGIVESARPAGGPSGDVVVRRNGTIATVRDFIQVFSSSGALIEESAADGGEGFRALAEQSTGALLAGAAGDCACSFVGRRLMPGLRLDQTFGGASGPGGVTALEVFVLSNDRALLVSDRWTDEPFGTTRPGITFSRLLADGTDDVSFGPGGVVHVDTATWPAGTAGVPAVASAMAPGSRSMVLGRTYLARFGANGARDTSFSGDGILPLSGATWKAVAVQGNSHALVVGSSGGDVVLRRYLGNGTITRTPSSVAVAPGGGTLTAGDVQSLASSDRNVLQVRSTTAGTAQVTSWSGSIEGVPNALSTLKVGYAGSASSSTTQTVEVYNARTSTWQALDTRTVGTGLVTLSDRSVPGTAADFVSGTSGDGRVEVRVRSSSASSFTVRADRLTVSYT